MDEDKDGSMDADTDGNGSGDRDDSWLLMMTKVVT
jgi:hypothetical protein